MKTGHVAASAALSILLVLFAIPCVAADTTISVIEVNGSGEARSAPDVAYLSLQIETHAAKAEDCSARNAALAQKVVQQLKDKLAGKGVILTGDYSLTPEYSEPGPRAVERKPGIIGYTAQNTITVETGELALMGSLIDGAIGAGANRINYLNFALRDDTKARQLAITNASKDAQAQAQALANSLGVKLKRIIKASTLPQQVPIMPMRAGFAAMESTARVPTPIEATQITVSATVSLTYEIE